MNKTLAAILALALPVTAACGSVESPDDEMTQPTPDDPQPDPEQPQPDPEAQPGTVDTLYGSNGYLELDGVLGYPNDLAVQGDKLVVCSTAMVSGKNRAVLTRIGFDGAVDTTFGLEDGRFMQFAENSNCGGVVVRPDNSVVAFIRVPGSLNAIFRFDPDAQGFAPAIASSSFKAMNLTEDDQLLAAATTAGGFSSRDAENPTDIASTQAITGSATRPFMINGKHALAGVFANGASGWTVMIEEAEGQFPMPTKLVNLGNPMTNDFMHHAVQLANGSILAVGSADSELDAMVGLLGPGDPLAAIRDIGLTSTFRRALIDGADHALLFGTTTMSGGAQIMWQRIATATLAVDPNYAGGGTMVLPAFQGSGDIANAVHYNGATYLLTSYGVETITPGAALLKINE